MINFASNCSASERPYVTAFFEGSEKSTGTKIFLKEITDALPGIAQVLGLLCYAFNFNGAVRRHCGNRADGSKYGRKHSPDDADSQRKLGHYSPFVFDDNPANVSFLD